MLHRCWKPLERNGRNDRLEPSTSTAPGYPSAADSTKGDSALGLRTGPEAGRSQFIHTALREHPTHTQRSEAVWGALRRVRIGGAHGGKQLQKSLFRRAAEDSPPAEKFRGSPPRKASDQQAEAAVVPYSDISNNLQDVGAPVKLAPIFSTTPEPRGEACSTPTAPSEGVGKTRKRARYKDLRRRCKRCEFFLRAGLRKSLAGQLSGGGTTEPSGSASSSAAAAAATAVASAPSTVSLTR